MVVNAARFELPNVRSRAVQRRALMQFNRISHDLAARVAAAVGLPAPSPDSTYYHSNKTSGVSTFGNPLPHIHMLNIGILATASSPRESLAQAGAIAEALRAKGANPTVIAEYLAEGVGATYSGADAVLYDGIIVTDDTKVLCAPPSSSSSPLSSLYPRGRPAQIVRDAFNYGKPVAAIGHGAECFKKEVVGGVQVRGKGVYSAKAWSSALLAEIGRAHV